MSEEPPQWKRDRDWGLSPREQIQVKATVDLLVGRFNRLETLLWTLLIGVSTELVMKLSGR